MTIKVLIVEDEQLAADKLVRHAERLDTDIQIIGVITSNRDLISFIKSGDPVPDLILSDIELEDGLSLEAYKQLATDIPVIFTTAYDQYAIEAFKTNSVDYLLKPVSLKALEEAIQKYARTRHIEDNNQPDFASLFSQLSRQAESYKERFLVQSGGGQLKSIKVSDVAYFFADGKHTMLIDSGGSKYFSDQNITQLSEVLDPAHFHQINRKYIIHIDSIREMHHYSKSRIKLILHPPAHDEVIVSVERSPAFKQWLGK